MNTADRFFAPLDCRPGMRPIVFLWRMVQLQPRLAALATITVTLLGFVEGLSLALLLPLLGELGLNTGSRAGGITRAVDRLFGLLHVPISLTTVLLVFFAAGMFQILLTAAQQYVVVIAGEHLTIFIRRRLFDAASRADWHTLAAGRGGYLVNAVVSEASRIGVIYGNAITAYGLILNFLIYLGLSAWVSWQFTLVVALIGAVSMLALRRLYRSSRRFGKYTSAATNRLQEVLNEHVASAKLIRAFGAGPWSRALFGGAAEDVAAYGRRNQLNTVLVRTSVEPIGLVTLVVLIYLSIAVVKLPVAELMVLLVIFYRVTPRLVSLQELLQRIAGVLPGYESVAATLSTLEHAAEHHGRRSFEGTRTNIHVEDVTVSHGSQVVLDGLTLTIPVRTTVALVGASGGGKTTLLDLLTGVLPPERGRVLIDGVPLDEFDTDSYRRRIGIVPQDSWMFHDTIAANLRFAAPDASDEDLWEALATAHADRFLKESGKGLDTVVGDQGLRMSGGQRQRLSLARALLRKPDILLLDEPSSALDAETEAVLRETFKRLRGTMTIVLVSHRPALAEDADVVYQIANGRAELLHGTPARA